MSDKSDPTATREHIPLWESWPSRVLSIVVALVIFSMMGLTFVDVIGRYVFNAPISGTYELITFLMALAVFSGLPLVTASKSHITVSLLDPFMKGGQRWIQELVVLIFSAVVVAFLGYRLWFQGEALREDEVITQVLKAPIAPVAYYTSMLCAMSFIILVVMIWHHLRGNRSKSKN